MIINLISSPRNISTALMYSFAQRTDTKVIDEPFYAYYLLNGGADHPGREEIINSQPTTIQGVCDWIDEVASTNKVVFVKNMAHHLIDADLDFLDKFTNVFLIRDPALLIASFAKVIEKPTMEAIGIARQFELYERLSLNGHCPVIDSGNVLANPKNVLKKLCEEIYIPFEEQMLHWEKGALAEDGIWAKYWYDNVHNSTGFAAPIKTHIPELTSELQLLLAASLPYYSQLSANSIK
jgi:hypothetical protein